MEKDDATKEKVKTLSGFLSKTRNKAIGGTGVIGLFLFLQSDISSKINSAEARAIQYADSKHALVESDIKTIKEAQIDIRDTLKLIDKRLYNLKHKLDSSEDE